MNPTIAMATLNHTQPDAQAAPPAEHVRQALRALLARPAFARAPRMAHLLSYLIEEQLSGRSQDISEYAIGLEVFRRDAHLYDTTLDPVVRVQMGRLRERLNACRATPGMAGEAGLEISIPAGAYVPLVRRSGAALPGPHRPHRPRRPIVLAPLRDLNANRDSAGFVSGVDEELGSRLYLDLGGAVLLTDDAGVTRGGADGAPAQRLEGSIRIEHDHVRASMRLVDPKAGRISWLSQFDCSGPLGMPLQEQLAGAICTALQRHLALT